MDALSFKPGDNYDAMAAVVNIYLTMEELHADLQDDFFEELNRFLPSKKRLEKIRQRISKVEWLIESASALNRPTGWK